MKLEEVKKQYLKAPFESLDRRQFHAELSYSLAGVYSLMGQEAALTKATAKRQLEILSGLAKSLKYGEASLSSKQAEIVVNSAKPIIENSRSLFQSLTQFKDRLKDPEIVAKLNGAVSVGRMLDRYLDELNRGIAGRNNSQKVLEKKLAEICEQLSAIYAQADIMGRMIEDRKALQRLVNELAASDLILITLGEGGGKPAGEMAERILDPLKEGIKDTDEPLGLLIDGVGQAETALPKARTDQWSNF